jgi:hypothetical protein
LLDGFDSSSFDSFNISIYESLNITAIYKDNLDSFIEDAELKLIGDSVAVTLNLSRCPLYNQYNVTFNKLDLDVGMQLLTLYAQKENYQLQSSHLTIAVLESEMKANIYLNGVNKTSDPTFTTPIRSILNITIEYYDIENYNPITVALVQVIVEVFPFLLNLTENPLNHQYSISINTSLLGIGAKLLIVDCSKSITILFQGF